MRKNTHREVRSLFLGMVTEPKEAYKLVHNVDGVVVHSVQMDEYGERRDAASERGKR